MPEFRIAWRAREGTCFRLASRRSSYVTVAAMNRDPVDLRSEAAAYRDLALSLGGQSMNDALNEAAAALEALATEIEKYQACLSGESGT